MAKALPIPPSDPTTLPPLIATPMVLALAGYSSGTLWSRIKTGRMPKPFERGGQGFIWRRDDILLALGLRADTNAPPEPSGWDSFDPAKYDAYVEREREDRAFARKMARQAAKPVVKAKPGPKAKPKGPTDLGKYVVMKLRANGRYAVYFQVPKRLRPNGWRPTINLPLDEPRSGDMNDRKEVARIRADAASLFRSMNRERLAQMRGRAVANRAHMKEPDA